MSLSGAGVRGETSGKRRGGVPDEPTRRWLLAKLRDILEIAMERVTSSKTPAPDRIKWSRIVIGAGQACNSVLRDVEIEALKEQIKELRELALAKLSDESGEDQEGDTEP